MNMIEFSELVARYGEQKAEEIREEKAAVARLRECLGIIGSDLKWYWHWGDGEGGFVLLELARVVRENGRRWPDDSEAERPTKSKARIGRSLARKVMERDAYRCKHCGTHIDLTCDHVVPESAGGETAFSNLQTLCRSCNSRKGTKAA